MGKSMHEVRDPVHVFVRYNSDEKRVIDSRPFQRLRHIHQLSLTSFVYPGATHKRFEHCLGVMELASRVFDRITEPDRIGDYSGSCIPKRKDALAYWRSVLRMASLCHDMGHLPFSHGPEGLLPKGWSHERITYEIIRSKELESIWNTMTPPLRSEDVAKIAVGPDELGKWERGVKYDAWEGIVSEIITGDALGADRMDYLLRDSLHCGVPYGNFDHNRLIDTICVLPRAEDRSDDAQVLGIEIGGLHTAEALLVARYMVFSQLYFHHVRRVYDMHLNRFLMACKSQGPLSDWLNHPTDVPQHLEVTDNEVFSELYRAYRQREHPGYDQARRIIERQHYRKVYERNPSDQAIRIDATYAVFNALAEEFERENVWPDTPSKKAGRVSFPVLMFDGQVELSSAVSEVLARLPSVTKEYVFACPELRNKIKQWLGNNRDSVLKSETFLGKEG
jgi:hypothetical protein